MDRDWINKHRLSDEYMQGIDCFLNFAFEKASSDGKILCPCVKCVNSYWLSRQDVYDHLVCHGFCRGYTRWFCHGESSSASTPVGETHVQGELNVLDNMQTMLSEMFGMCSQVGDEHGGDSQVGDENEGYSQVGDEHRNASTQQTREGPNVEAEKFYNLLKDASQELYPGCKKFSVLSFIVHLFHLKCLGGWSGKSFTLLLELLKDLLPEGTKLPETYYGTKKIINELGLGYEKIHACPNDCMLFWNEKTTEDVCSKCGASRWKTKKNDVEDGTTTSSNTKKRKAAKILRWFPLKPRLQRLFMSSKTASFMRWHEEGRNKDGLLRHPADSLAWKAFDDRYPDFSADPRNVRLGLASDGFNPFKNMSSTHSTWPVILFPYNLPPWMCMKQPSFILSLLIPGPDAPGNDIDVYLQPLIEELKELWEIGIDTYDVSSNQTFQLRAALMWTINDFPAYANLSGWSTRGELACPTCNYDTCSRWLDNGKKYCYMGHRRLLDPSHKFRYDKKSFDGKEELRCAPIPLSGSAVLSKLEGVEFTFGKQNKKTKKKSKKRSRREEGQDEEQDQDEVQVQDEEKDQEEVELNTEATQPWKKRSIFFMLPYWKYNLLRHNLDVMHIEKNVCDNLLWTLLNMEGKSKDNLKARLDLQEMGIRHELHPQESSSKRIYLPPACFTMSVEEKDLFCKILKEVKLPDGYGSNISRCVRLKDRKITGMKSHDAHVIMEDLLAVALRGVLPKTVSSVVIE